MARGQRGGHSRSAAVRGYPGAKAGAGVYQTIINEMPPHEVYLEAFAGSGAILLRKRPAAQSIVIDADADVARGWSTIAASSGGALIAHHGDARSIIASYGERIHKGWLIYADPPYVRATRRSSRPLYRHELTDADHRSLLSLLLTVKASVMLSGYRSPLYDEMLAGWRRIDYRVGTHGGPATESLWCNFEAAERHEYTYLGRDFRERERIKRKVQRWCRRLAGMGELERNALLQALAQTALEHRQTRRAAPARATA